MYGLRRVAVIAIVIKTMGREFDLRMVINSLATLLLFSISIIISEHSELKNNILFNSLPAFCTPFHNGLQPIRDLRILSHRMEHS